jgi:anti-anti-sigma factor
MVPLGVEGEPFARGSTSSARAMSHAISNLIDLADVDYVSSAGLNALATAAGLCAQARAVMAPCGLTDPVRIAFDLGGLLPRLAIAPSRDHAIVRVALS